MEHGVMNKYLLLSLVLLLLTSCNKYKIEGSASDAGLDGRMLYVKVLNADKVWHSIDSCEVIHGEFSMKGEADSTMMATLFMDNMAILPLVVEKGTMKVTMSGTETKVDGTPLNEALYDFLHKQSELENKVQELFHKESQMILNGENPDEAHEMVNREGKKLSDEMSKLVVDFITGNFDNVLSVGVFALIASNMPYPVVTPEIQQIMEKAPTSFKEHFLVKEFMSVAQENMERMNE